MPLLSQNWHHISGPDGLNNAKLNFVQFDKRNNLFTGNGDNIFLWSDKDANWQIISLPKLEHDSDYMADVHITPLGSILLTERQYYDFPAREVYSVLRSGNKGTSWDTVIKSINNTNIINLTEGEIWTARYINDGYGNSEHSYLYRSTDDGLTWKKHPNSFKADGRIKLISTNTKGMVYAQGSTYEYSQYSNNNGLSWGSWSNEEYFTDLKISSSGYLICLNNANSTNTIMRSLDNGESWQEINTGLPGDITINSIILDSNDYIYAATNKGVYRANTKADPVTWYDLQSWSLSNKNILCLGISADGTLFAGTEGSGLFKYSGDYTAVNENKEQANSTAIPNPACDEISINIANIKGTSALLDIYNLAGNLIDKRSIAINEGSLSAKINTASFESGLYYYTVSTDSGRYTGKFSVIH
jgi:photosystem II stability/assembly factor-like uncharacterized protein